MPSPSPADSNAARPAAQAAIPQDCDVLVVGGGVNGAGIARDLAGRGWRVLLVEQDDLAAHTSSASTKLIHGGLRYLEYLEFGLVRKALQEREVLLRSAPHIMWPLRFVMPHDPGSSVLRPPWLIRLGLFLYDNLARRELLPGSRAVDLRTHLLGRPLQAQFTRGFIYSDGWVDDARLVVLNAIDARERGATVCTRTRCVAARRGAADWAVQLVDGCGALHDVRARALVNATGPWAGIFLRERVHPAHGERLVTRSLRLVQGSHIVVPRCFDHDHAYLFQSPDRRIIFAIPYEGRYTLIGTTDVEVHGDPGTARISDAEVSYLCTQASRYLRLPVEPAQVVWSYSGVRPLLDDESGNPSALTRDYLLEHDSSAAPLLTVWGGKITTFRRLAEEAAGEIGRLLGARGGPWTARACLPGGDLSAWYESRRRPDVAFENFLHAMRGRYAWLAPALCERLARAYGTRLERVLGPARSPAELGAEVAPGLHEAELRYLQREEWAVTGDDVLWRRSKLGLQYSREERARVEAWMQAQRAGLAQALGATAVSGA